MPVSKIPSSEVELGMYIASLDRPWSETPFLFQGFEVHNQQEIDELHDQSNFVYIMVPDEEIELKKPASYHDGAVKKSNRLHKVNYENRVSAMDELKAIREVHETVVQLVSDIESLIQSEGTLRIEDLGQPVRVLVDSVIKNPDASLWLTRIRKFDSFVYKDSLSSAVWATALGRNMGMDENDLYTLATGCMLMDVGKLALPPELLHKTERLTHDEWEQMKSHVELGLSMLQNDPDCSPDILDIIRTHHERIDGSGFPAGLHGSQIPLFGQIAGIVDFYVAITTPRPFASVISPSLAEQMLYDNRDNYFDESLVESFIQTLGTYPTGSLVELSTGEVAIVMAQNPGLRLKPDIVMLLNEHKQQYDSFVWVSLPSYTRNDIPINIKHTLKDGSYGLSIDEIRL